MLCCMVARVGIFSALLLSWVSCVSAPRVSTQSAQTSPSTSQIKDKLTKKEKWTLVFAGVSAGVSLIGAGLSIWYLRKNVKLSKQIADRTVTVESQKLLLEINKQYLSNPALFAIYNDHPGREKLLKDCPALADKIKALGYLKLNVFEIVFA